MEIGRWWDRYSLAVSLALLAGVAYVGALTISGHLAERGPAQTASSVAVAPLLVRPGPENQWPVESIVARDIFGAARKTPAAELAGDSASPSLGALPLKLIVIAFYRTNDPENLAVIFNVQEKKTELYQAGDTVSGEARINSIEIDRVILVRPGGEREELTLAKAGGEPSGPIISPPAPESRPPSVSTRFQRLGDRDNPGPALALSEQITQLAPHQFQIEKALLETVLGTPGALISQARIRPSEDGLHFTWIQPGSLFQRLGLQTGDVVQSLNGQNLENLETTLRLLQSLSSQTGFTLLIGRAGSTLEMNYDVE